MGCPFKDIPWKRGAQDPKIAASGLMSPAQNKIDTGDISPGLRAIHDPAQARERRRTPTSPQHEVGCY